MQEGFRFAVLQYYEEVALFKDEDLARSFAKQLYNDTHDTVDIAYWREDLEKYKAYERME